MSADDRITVTMTRAAATAASDALTRAYCRMTPDIYPPTNEKARKDFETTDWLRWLISRIEIGCRAEPEVCPVCLLPECERPHPECSPGRGKT